MTCALYSDLAQPCHPPDVSRSGKRTNCTPQVCRTTTVKGEGRTAIAILKSLCTVLLLPTYVYNLYADHVCVSICRKKYFLKNEDLDEYSKTNSLLLENIYAQVREVLFVVHGREWTDRKFCLHALFLLQIHY